MGNVEFTTKARGVTLNVTYGGITNDDVGVEIFTPFGEIGCMISERTAAQLHESLGAYLDLRRKARKESRDRKRASKKDAPTPRRVGARRNDGGNGGGGHGGPIW